ncbi:polysaccharide pyruvyl transferase family protein [Mycetocola sp.]|uniref:polysaccharide pyruvyl transferase family protein n=1 Tax=Mycetocola sp. TaxID=1871042 RepID=UPI003989EA8A
MTGRSKRRAYVVGFYGVANFGDDLFCDVVESHAALMFPGYDVRIVGRVTQPRTALKRAFRRIFASPHSAGSAIRLLTGLWVVARGDLIILGGGSVLSELRGVRYVQWKLSRILRTRFRAVGVSLGPFADMKRRGAVATFAQGLDKLIVRDSRSLDVGHSLGLDHSLTLGGDLAALYAPPTTELPGVRHGHIGLSLCSISGAESNDPDLITRSLADAILQMPESERMTVVVLSLNNHKIHGDDEVSENAVRHLRERGIEVKYSRYIDVGVEGVWNEIASLQAVVAVRLHAAICAYLAGVPFALVEYHSKCTDFCNDIGQHDSMRIPASADRSTLSTAVSALLKVPCSPAVSPDAYSARAVATYLSYGVSVGSTLSDQKVMAYQ